MTGVDGAGAPAEPEAQEPRETPKKSRLHRALEIIISVIVIGSIFGFAFPKIAGSDYSEIWDQFQRLGWLDLVLLFVVWLINMYTYTPVLTHSLPGLMRFQGLVVNLSGSAVSNTVPFGGALGVGATYAMYQSWGFRIPAITRSILVSGFWNVFAKLGLPVLALVLLLLNGDDTSGLVLATAVGVVTLAAAIVILWLVLRSDPLARAIGGLGQRVTSRLLRFVGKDPVFGWDEAAVEFRHDSVGLLHRQWLGLTSWILVYNTGQYLILLLALRMLGVNEAELGWVQIFAAFSFGRLLSVIPLTPSGVGFVETGLVGALRAFGGPPAPVAAGVLVFSAFTYLLEIPMGAVGWVIWSTRRSWRRPVGSRDQGAAATR